MKPGQLIESTIRIVSVSVVLALIVTAGSGCAQMLGRQRARLAESLASSMRAEVAQAAVEVHDDLLAELRSDVTDQVGTAIDGAVEAARNEAVAVIQEAGADPAKLRQAMVDIARQEGVDAQTLIDRSVSAAKSDLVSYTNGQIDALDSRLQQSNEIIADKADKAARTAVEVHVQTFEETARKVTGEAVGAASSTALITGAGSTGLVGVGLFVAQWLWNRRRQKIVPTGRPIAAATMDFSPPPPPTV